MNTKHTQRKSFVSFFRVAVCVCWLVCITLICSAQNLVTNPNFEQYIACPTQSAQITTHCESWYQYTIGTPDYFNECAYLNSLVSIPDNFYGSQPAINKAYAGLYAYYHPDTIGREYIAASMTAMDIGTYYKVSISVSLADKSNFGIDGLGVFFYKNFIDTYKINTAVLVNSQIDYSRYGVILDTTKWIRLNGYMVADSSYDHIVIGSFKETSAISKVKYQNGVGNYSYYYIDSVVVERASNINIEYTDSMLCVGDTISVNCFIKPGVFNANNVFNLQISDKHGSFSTPQTIGSYVGDNTNAINAIIPTFLPQGDHYRIRLSANSPSLISEDNGRDIQIGTSKPTISNTTYNTPLCVDSSLTITASSSLNASIWYWWKPIQYPIETSTNVFAKPNVTLSDSGLYIVAASNNGCLSNPDTITISVNNNISPIVNLRVKEGYNIGIGNQLTLYTSSLNEGISPKYQWFKNGAIIPGATDTFYQVILGTTFVENDSFCVELTSSIPCPINKTVSKCLSYNKYVNIESLISENALIHPNPVESNLFIKNLTTGTTIEIFNWIGQKVYMSVKSTNSKETSLDLSDLSTGMYIIMLTKPSGQVSSQKFIRR